MKLKLKEIKILSSNGIDENNAIVLNPNTNSNPNYERNHRYYERNKEKLLQYYHDRYYPNRD